jgi:hypothetical protein
MAETGGFRCAFSGTQVTTVVQSDLTCEVPKTLKVPGDTNCSQVNVAVTYDKVEPPVVYPIFGSFLACAKPLQIMSITPTLLFHQGTDYNTTLKLSLNQELPIAYYCKVLYSVLESTNKSEIYPAEAYSCPVRVSKDFGSLLSL